MMEFYERVSGARLHAAYVRPGGVAQVRPFISQGYSLYHPQNSVNTNLPLLNVRDSHQWVHQLPVTFIN